MGPELSQAPSLADVSLSDDHFQGVDIFSVRSLPIHQISVSVPFLPSLLTSLHELCVLPSAFSFTSQVFPAITMVGFHSVFCWFCYFSESAVSFLLFILSPKHAKGNLYSLPFPCFPLSELTPILASLTLLKAPVMLSTREQ